MARRRALVTGASRGIGKAIALELAKAEFDLVISARTVKAGEVRDNSLTVRQSDTRPLPGSLEETAEAVRAAGADVLVVPLDLTDRASVGACAQKIIDEWGAIDAIVHNGRHLGPGLMDLFMDIPVDAFGKFFEAHCVGPIILTKALLPGMLARGAAQVVTISSGAAFETPPAPPGKGGWGLGYSVGKASGHPLVGALHVEYHQSGLRAFNVQPGYVATERNEISVRDYGRELVGAAPPAAIGAVIGWLLTAPEAAALSGTMIEAQPFCLERKLYPAWT